MKTQQELEWLGRLLQRFAVVGHAAMGACNEIVHRFPRVRTVAAMVSISLSLLVTEAFAEDSPETTDDFFAFLVADLPNSGEITILTTNYFRTAVPQVRTYHAIWREHDFFMEELPLKGTNPVTYVSGLLVGCENSMEWFAQNDELDYFMVPHADPTYNPATDNNSVHYMVGFARSVLSTQLKGGFNSKSVRRQGDTISIEVLKGPSFEGRAALGVEPKRLLAHSTTGDGIRADYSEWRLVDGIRYPLRYVRYVQSPGDKHSILANAARFIQFEIPWKGGNETVFRPEGHILTNAFNPYVYITNKDFYIEQSGLVAVKHMPVPSKTPWWRFVIIVTLISVVFITLALRFRAKTQQTTYK